MLNGPLKSQAGMSLFQPPQITVAEAASLQTAKPGHHKILEKRSPHSAMTKSFGPSPHLVGSGLTADADMHLQVPISMD